MAIIEFYIVIKTIIVNNLTKYKIGSILLIPDHENIIKEYPDHVHPCDNSIIPEDMPEVRAAVGKKRYPDFSGLKINTLTKNK